MGGLAYQPERGVELECWIQHAEDLADLAVIREEGQPESPSQGYGGRIDIGEVSCRLHQGLDEGISQECRGLRGDEPRLFQWIPIGGKPGGLPFFIQRATKALCLLFHLGEDEQRPIQRAEDIDGSFRRHQVDGRAGISDDLFRRHRLSRPPSLEDVFTQVQNQVTALGGFHLA